MKKADRFTANPYGNEDNQADDNSTLYANVMPARKTTVVFYLRYSPILLNPRNLSQIILVFALFIR